MRIVRWIVAILLACYGLFDLFPLITMFGAKGGWIPLTGDAARLQPLVAASPWWEAPIWLVVVALYLVVGWRLLRGQRALALYAVTFLIEILRWLPMQATPAYRQAFTPAELQLDYWTFGALLVVGAVIWVLERRAPPEPKAA